ncbi:MAG: hypothetical protein CL610_08270 [Anaerolineaceae bacterium]|nr:hypothetical protein [Anaerolineaceae bacterium]
MKITGLTARLLEIDARPRFGDEGVPPGRPSVWHYPLFVLHTDAGIDGYSMGYGNQGDGKALAHLVRDVYLAELLGENPLFVEAIWHKIRRRTRHMYALMDSVVGIIDVALWDIVGKQMQQPIAMLLGAYRTRVPGYATGYSFHPTPDIVFKEASQMKQAGYHGYKLHFWNDPKTDIPCMYAAREAVGPGFPLMQDLNSKYNLTQALEAGRVLDELNFYWFEEPIPERQMANVRKLADELKTPILGGETLRLDEMAEHIRYGAFDIARGDVYSKAGITGLYKTYAMCELFGLNLEVHTMATPLLDVANLHVACAVQNGEFMEIIHPVYRFGMVGNPLDIDADGYLHMPQGPGLGIELDWDWIEDHTIEVITGP